MLQSLLSARLFINNLRNLQGPQPTHHLVRGGMQYELYTPPHPQQTIVLVYGFGLSGETDPRLVRFAQAFATVGVQVAVPILDGLKGYLFDPNDLEILIAICRHMSGQNHRPVGVVAFSAGASLALSAARHPDLSTVLDPLILFSPIADMIETWCTFHQKILLPPEGTKSWDDYIWAQCVITWRNRETLRLNPANTTHLANALRRYSVGMRTIEKKKLYQNLIVPLDPLSHADLLCEEHAMNELSPLGKVQDIRANVVMFHNKHDYLVPASHSEKLFRQLRARGEGREHLLITTALAHANVNRLPNLREVWQVIKLMGIIFERGKINSQ